MGNLTDDFLALHGFEFLLCNFELVWSQPQRLGFLGFLCLKFVAGSFFVVHGLFCSTAAGLLLYVDVPIFGFRSFAV